MILAGIVIMVGSDAFIGQLGGALLALMMTFSMASMIVIMRVKKSVSMLPASCLSAFLSSIVVWPIASEAIPTGTTMFHLVLFFRFGLGLTLLTLGTRHITALRSSLLHRLQTVLGPLWVWLVFAEVPPATTIVGGSIVLVATVAASLFGRDVAQLATRSPITKNEGPSNDLGLLFIDLVFIPDFFRGHGLGSRMLHMAEEGGLVVVSTRSSTPSASRPQSSTPSMDGMSSEGSLAFQLVPVGYS